MKKLVTLILTIITSLSINAQWSNTTNIFNDGLHMPVCTEVGNQNNSIVINSYPDGGYFLIWEDKRSGPLYHIYAQKYDKDGNRLWAQNGVPISSSANEQRFSYTGTTADYRNKSFGATDSANGLYLTYTDETNIGKSIVVQHLTNNGNTVFSGAGYTMGSPGATFTVTTPQLIADDNHGFYISFSKNFISPLSGNVLYTYCYKDIAGTMTLIGGGQVNQNALQEHTAVNCSLGNRYFLSYPQLNVIDYNIWPDLQGGCNIIMHMDGVTTIYGTTISGKMLGYNRLWKAKKNSVVANVTRTVSGNLDTFYINYNIGDVGMMYKIKHEVLNRICGGPGGTIITFTDDNLISNGFKLYGFGGYDYNFPKGTTVPTDGNINVQLIATLYRSYSLATGVSEPSIGSATYIEEKLDSIPYQNATNYNPDEGYNTAIPPNINTLEPFSDTLLAARGNFFDFSLAGGGTHIYTATVLYKPGQVTGARDVRLQHLAVERQTASSFAVKIKTNSNQGVVIGSELVSSNGNITYDFPHVVANNTGNALFYITETGRSVKVSPIQNGAELAWGAMGKPIGYASNHFPNNPFAALDPVNGTGVICWDGLKNIPANTGTNIYMRHLDSINVVNYQPGNNKIQLLANGITDANPAVLSGSSNHYTTLEVYNNSTGNASPIAEIFDNYNLGFVPVKIYQNIGAIRTYNGKPYLDRNYTITPQNNPNGTASIKLRLFFTDVEFDALKTADPTIINPGLLVVIKQPNTSGAIPSSYTPIAGETTVVPDLWKAADGGYYLEITVTGFSNFFIQKGAGALPVTWLGVQAQWQNNTQAKISWQVANQINVKDYTVQQSVDGIIYTDACVVAASLLTNYSCIIAAGGSNKNYYRVLQKDIDGKKSYSNVVALQSITTPVVSVYPNPTKDKLYINGLNSFTTVSITDVSGRIIIAPFIASNYININHLAKGIYFIRLTANNTTQAIKFIKE